MSTASVRARPQELVERGLAASKADGCVVIVEDASTANLRWATNTLTTNGVATSRRVVVISTIGHKQGIAVGVVARSSRMAEAVEHIVERSEAAARDNSPAEDAQPLVDGVPSSPHWDDAEAETTINVFGGFTPGLGEALDAARGADRVLAGFAEHELSSTYLGTSTGLRLRHDQPTGKVEITGRSNDGTRSAWTGAATRDFKDVDASTLDTRLRRRLAWGDRQIDLPAGRYEVVLPPSAVGDLMVYLYWTASARDAHDGRTVFSKPGGGTRVGDRLTEASVTLRSNPSEPGLECHSHAVTIASSSDGSVFDNGLPIGAQSWIDDGVLQSLVSTRHSAGLTGLPLSPGVDNLILEGPDGGRSISDMVRGTQRGLLLTCLWYIREVDPRTLLLTGLTRDGVFLIENGEVVGAVNNFRFNESPVDLLGRATEIGVTQPTLPREWADYFTRAAMPTMRIPDFNMSSVSQAQ
jgi:predicted Zn-dependent protease